MTKNELITYVTNLYSNVLKKIDIKIQGNKLSLRNGGTRISLGREDAGMVLYPETGMVMFHKPKYMLKTAKNKMSKFSEFISFYAEDKPAVKRVFKEELDKLNLPSNEKKQIENIIFNEVKRTPEQLEAEKQERKIKDVIGATFLQYCKMLPDLFVEQEETYLAKTKQINPSTLSSLNVFQIKEENLDKLMSGFFKYSTKLFEFLKSKNLEFFNINEINNVEGMLNYFNINVENFNKKEIIYFNKTQMGESIQLRAAKPVRDYNQRYRLIGRQSAFKHNIPEYGKKTNIETLIVAEGMTDFISMLDTLKFATNTIDNQALSKTGIYSSQSASSSVYEIINLLKYNPSIIRVLFLNDNDMAGNEFIKNIMEKQILEESSREISFVNGTEYISEKLNNIEFDVSDLKIKQPELLLSILKDSIENKQQLPRIKSSDFNNITLYNETNKPNNSYIANGEQYFIASDVQDAFNQGKAVLIHIGGNDSGKYVHLDTQNKINQFLKGEDLYNIEFKEYKEQKYTRTHYSYQDLISEVEKFKSNQEYLELTEKEKEIYEKRINKGIDYLTDVHDRIKSNNPKKAASFIDYFFQIQKFTQYLQSKNIIYAPNGSASGSIIVKILGISTVPLKELISNYQTSEERYLNPYINVESYMPDIDVETPSDAQTKEIISEYLYSQGLKKALLETVNGYAIHPVKHYFQETKTNLPHIAQRNDELLENEVALDILVRAYRNDIQELSNQVGTHTINELRDFFEFQDEYNCSIRDLQAGIVGGLQIPQFRMLALTAAHKFFGANYDFDYSIKATNQNKREVVFFKIKDTDKYADKSGNLYKESDGNIVSVFEGNTAVYVKNQSTKSEKFKQHPSYIANQEKLDNVQITKEELEYFTALSRPFYTNGITYTQLENGEKAIFEFDRDTKIVHRLDKPADLDTTNLPKSNQPETIQTPKSSSGVKIIVCPNFKKEEEQYYILQNTNTTLLVPIKYINKDLNTIPQKDIQEIASIEGNKYNLKNSKYYKLSKREELYTGPLGNNGNFSPIAKNEGVNQTTRSDGEYQDKYNQQYVIIEKEGNKVLKRTDKNIEYTILEENSKGAKTFFKVKKSDGNSMNMYLDDLSNDKQGLAIEEFFTKPYVTELQITEPATYQSLGFSKPITLHSDSRYMFNKFLENFQQNLGSHFETLKKTNGVFAFQENVMDFIEEIYSMKYLSRDDYYSKINYLRKVYTNEEKVPVEVIKKISTEYIPELREIIENIPEDSKRIEGINILNEQILRPALLFNVPHSHTLGDAAILKIIKNRDLSYLKNLIIEDEEQELLSNIYETSEDKTSFKKIGGIIYVRKELMSHFKDIIDLFNIIFNGKSSSNTNFIKTPKLLEYINIQLNKLETKQYPKFYTGLVSAYLKKVDSNTSELTEQDRLVIMNSANILITPPTINKVKNALRQDPNPM